MNEETQKLEISKETVEAFILCLALGTLEAMKSDIWSLDAGIWTIRRPVFFEKLKEFGISQNLLEELDQLDELSALKSASDADKVTAEIERIEKILKQQLSLHSDTFWNAKWSEI